MIDALPLCVAIGCAQGQGTNNGFCGHSALHWAAAKGHPDVLRYLLGEGAAVNLINNGGATALHAAAGNGQNECVRLLLLEGGADLQVGGCCMETKGVLMKARGCNHRTEAGLVNVVAQAGAQDIHAVLRSPTRAGSSVLLY